MKKVLSLVLALVMVLGLATVGANAAFPDAEDVSLNEAVDVMSALGVFKGDENGKFNPAANLDRASAAKLIAYLDLGEKTAEALPAVQAFPDVPANHWAAKYVAYCKNAGYLSGDANGNFLPAVALNGYAFGKMILGVLGYDAVLEGLSGTTNWTINVAKLMQSNKISDGISSDASQTLTREQGAQYCMNALKATMVEYASKGTSVTINGASIATGASAASAVKVNLTANGYATAISNDWTGNGDYSVQLGEKLYNGDLKRTTPPDDFGRAAEAWTYKLKSVGTYATSADIVLKNGTTYGAIYDAIGKTALDHLGTFSLYIDGVEVAAKTGHAGTPAGSVNPALITKGNKNDFQYDTDSKTWNGANLAKVNGNGATTYLYVNWDGAAYNVTACVINTYIAEVTAVTNATASANRKINLINRGVTPKAIAPYETESFAKGDFVLYTADFSGATASVKTIKTVTPAATAAVTSKRSDNANMVADGTTYKFSDKNNVAGTITVGNSYELYLDDEGFVIYAKIYNDAVDFAKYLVVTADHSDTTLGATKVTANAVALDGTKLSGITLGKLNNTKIDGSVDESDGTVRVAKNTVYSFVKDSDGKYNLKSVAVPYTSAALTITGGQAGTGFKFHAGSSVVGTGVTANAATKFVVFNDTADTVKVYEGIANMVNIANAATVTGTYIANASAASVAKLVFVETNAATSNASSAKDVIYVISNKYNMSEDDDHQYYTFSVVKDGEQTTITKKDSALDNQGTPAAITTGLYFISQYDGEYVDTIVPATTGTPDGNYTYTAIAAGQTAEYSDDVLTITGGSPSFVCTSSTGVYHIDSDGVMTVASLEDLTSTDTTLAYFIFEKTTDNMKTVQAVYVQET